MADTTPPNDEADRRLAERIGTLRAQGIPIRNADLADDEVIRALLAFRETQDVDPSDAQSERLWSAIGAETAPETTTTSSPAEPTWNPIRLFAWPQGMRWAVVASLVLFVALAWFFLADSSAPTPVAVADSSTTTYTAPDGSTIRLRPHSQLYRLSANDQRRYRLDGEALFEVTNQPNPFVVEAHDMRVRVLGTTFNVRTWNRPSVFLEEGRIQVGPAEGTETIELAPGQGSSLTPDGTLMPPTAADRAEVLGWLEDEVVFTERTAVSVASELEHHFDIAIALPDSVEKETLTGRLSLVDRQQSLDDLGAVLGGRFQQVDAKAFRFIPRQTQIP